MIGRKYFRDSCGCISTPRLVHDIFYFDHAGLGIDGGIA